MVSMILGHLVSNAIKFTPNGGEVKVSARFDPGKGITLTVADTGIGMSPHDISTAFETFGQVDSSLSRRYEGVGLGLPLARSMAQLHGADLELSSVPGEGTVATLRFPPARAVKPEAALAPKDPQPVLGPAA